MADAKTFMVEDAQLIFRNFRGEPGPFNKAGERSFCVILDPKVAETMAKDGWNVKTLKPREDEEGEEGTPYIQVKVKYEFRPPRVVMITSSGRTNMTQEMIGALDWANIQTVDLICNAFDWDVNGKQGVAAYLQSMFVTIDEDYLERKYAFVEKSE